VYKKGSSNYSLILYILQHRAYDHYALICLKESQTPMDFEGVTREDKIVPSFATGQQRWS